MEQEQTNPPEVTPATDGTPDVELLRAISANAECAHILAAIAAGGNPKELLATLLPAEGKPEAETLESIDAIPSSVDTCTSG